MVSEYCERHQVPFMVYNFVKKIQDLFKVIINITDPLTDIPRP